MRSDRKQSIYKIIMLVALTALITFMITSIFMYKVMGEQGIKYVGISTQTSSLAKTINYLKGFIEEHYVGEMDEEKMTQSAIKGYVAGLGDEYSEYISPDEMQEYMEDATGKYVGIGVYITTNTQTNQIVILMPIEQSPAEAAGLKAGDVITKVDGTEYTGEQLDEASDKMKGEEGSKVTLTILRGEETFDVEVERKTVQVNHVKAKMLENQIGYIEIDSFDDGTAKEFEEKYRELKNQNLKSLIIDLRNNGGGIVDEAVDIADLMIEKGKTILITKSKNNEEEQTKAEKERTITVPVVVLVNEYSASASEILAAALKENDNATLVGQKTYGKGIIQTVYSMSDGSGLKLTTEEYFTPNHNKIHEVGITPDVEVSLPEGKTLYDIEDNEDTQLQKAIELLK